MKFLMADWGPEKFRQVLQDEYLHEALPDGPAPAPAEARPARPRRRRQAEGRRQRRRVRAAHRPDHRQPARPVADLADEYGAGRVRTTTQQKLVILDVPDEQVEDLVAALAEHDLLVRPSAFRRGTMACTGLEFCKLAIVETKQHAQDLYAELEKRLPDFDEPIGDQRQRLPEQLRPVPDRGHRLQGLDGPRRQRRDGRGLPGAPGRTPRRRGRVRPQVPRPQGDQGRDRRLLRARAARLRRAPEPGERFAAYVARADEAWLL